MRRATLLMFVCAALGGWSSTAGAEPYWVRYDGTDFPENQGWTRTTYAGGATRSLEDGWLVLDGRQDIMIADAYTMSRPIDPDPDELFIMRWGLQVDDVTGWADPSVGVRSDEAWAVAFAFSESRIIDAFDLSISVNFEAGVPHEFELRSSDMRQYELYIDGIVALTGSFTHVVTTSKVIWGDDIVGAASRSRWDYFQFGVVPEPCTGLGLVLMMFTGINGRRVI